MKVILRFVVAFEDLRASAIVLVPAVLDRADAQIMSRAVSGREPLVPV